MPRFRLRTFLMAITALCLLLGWRVAAVESVERPIRELKKLGLEVHEYQEIYAFFHPGGPAFRDLPRRTYWQKLLLGYQIYDLPEAVAFPEDAELQDSDRQFARSIELIRSLPSIKVVYVATPKFTGDDLSALATVSSIKELDLSDLPIGDEVSPDLCNFSQLEVLRLWGTDLSLDAIKVLTKKLPKCEIHNDHIALQ